MTKPPPDNLMEWSKKDLITELERQRAINREWAERTHDPARSGGSSVDVAGDPHARGGVVMDVRGAVLLESMDVTLMDTKRDEPPAMALELAGRVNYETRHVRQMYLFGADGAAALVSQVIGLAQRASHADARFAVEFGEALNARMEDLP